MCIRDSNITMPALSPTMEEGNLSKWLEMCIRDRP